MVKRCSFYLCFLVFFIQLDDYVFDLVAPLQNIPTTILQFAIKMNELLKTQIIYFYPTVCMMGWLGKAAFFLLVKTVKNHRM